MISEELQRLSLPEIKKFQETKMAEILSYIQAYSPYYKQLFKQEKIDISKIKKIEDLQHIPITTKQDLQIRNMEFLCVPATQILDYVTTSGTLGEPVTFALTQNDLKRLALSEYLSYAFCEIGRASCRERV